MPTSITHSRPFGDVLSGTYANISPPETQHKPPVEDLGLVHVDLGTNGTVWRCAHSSLSHVYCSPIDWTAMGPTNGASGNKGARGGGGVGRSGKGGPGAGVLMAVQGRWLALVARSGKWLAKVCT